MFNKVGKRTIKVIILSGCKVVVSVVGLVVLMLFLGAFPLKITQTSGSLFSLVA